MSEALVVSNLLLWALVLILGAVVVALTRQIGLLHERIAPVGAMVTEQGPKVGDPAPEIETTDLDGFRVKVGGAGPRTLLFFLSPTCPVCDTLLPTLQKVVRDESNNVQLLLASDGDTPEVHREFVESRGLGDVPYLISTELGLAYQVAKLPTAVLIDERGIVRSRGLVNSREHLESLFVADVMSLASIQDHLARKRAEEGGTGAERDREGEREGDREQGGREREEKRAEKRAERRVEKREEKKDGEKAPVIALQDVSLRKEEPK